MKIQLLIIFLFIGNMALIWLAMHVKRLKLYKNLGSFFFIILPLLGVAFNQPKFDLDYFWWLIAGGVAILLGIAALFWAQLTFKKVFTNLAEIPSQLITAGPYQYIRHPMYLGLIFIYVGWWWLWAAVYSFYFGMFIILLIWLQAWLEEKIILEKNFGNYYLSYKQHTGMFWIK